MSHIRRLERLEQLAAPTPKMGECFVCCLQSVNDSRKGQEPRAWPCRPECRPNADRLNAMAEKIESEREAKCATC